MVANGHLGAPHYFGVVGVEAFPSRPIGAETTPTHVVATSHSVSDNFNYAAVIQINKLCLSHSRRLSLVYWQLLRCYVPTSRASGALVKGLVEMTGNISTNRNPDEVNLTNMLSVITRLRRASMISKLSPRRDNKTYTKTNSSKKQPTVTVYNTIKH